jgi:hypothetical protein
MTAILEIEAGLIDKLGGRKNMAFYAGLISLIVFLSIGKLTGGEFIAGLSIIFGLFAGTNTASKFSEKK